MSFKIKVRMPMYFVTNFYCVVSVVLNAIKNKTRGNITVTDIMV